MAATRISGMINAMPFGLFQRNKQAAVISDALWSQATAQFSFIAQQPEDEQQRLRALAQQFIAQKEWHGAGGFELTDEVMVAIAAQACLPVLHLSLDLFDSFVGVVVYPSGFVVPKSEVDEAGVVHEWDEEASGEAWAGGPVVLSWEDASTPDADAGYNVVVHEFAHKLDMADGVDDGIPMLDPRFHQGLSRAVFAHALESAYDAFNAHLDMLPDNESIEEIWGIDVYAAQHPVEFFAVSVESLLTRGTVTVEHPLHDWFALLARYLCLPSSGASRAP
ncbi:MAG: M90 family metallopeptidase [Burkholderiaceae bacterium]